MSDIQKLDMVKAHKLASLMLDAEKGFAAKRLNLNAYTDFAIQELGFAVTAAQVSTRVREFGIQRQAPLPTPDLDALASIVLAQGVDIVDLKERIARLEGWVNATFPQRSPLKAVL